VKVLG